MSSDTSTAKITRTTTLRCSVAAGEGALSRAVDRACNDIERDGNEIVSISHAAHQEGFRNERVWTVLIAYCKAR